MLVAARPEGGPSEGIAGAPSEGGAGENPVWKLVKIMIDKVAAFCSGSKLMQLVGLEANEGGLRVSTKTLHNYNSMKTNPSLKFFQPAGAAALAIVIACGLSVRPAQAGYIVTLEQVGPNVVATGSGAIDLTGLFPFEELVLSPQIIPAAGVILTGPTTALPTSLYSGFSTLPNFGPGGFAAASSGSGDLVGVIFSTLTVPQGYVSGNALSDSSTYDNATFFSLGVTPGTYEWTWGTGANQNFTLQIGPAGVPDAGSTIGLLFLSLIGLFGLNRLRHVQLA